MIHLDLRSSQPLYEQIISQYKYLYLQGFLKKGDAIPSVRKLALELDVPQGVMDTLQDVDARVREMGRLIGYGCNLALHRSLSLGEIPAFLS